jgi:DNA-binding transcriptional ArsR family regulator
MQERLEQNPASIGKSIAVAPSRDESRWASLLAAAGDPIRLRILGMLREPLAVTDLCHELNMAQPRVSHHLAVLRESGLLTCEPRGRRRIYRWAITSSPPVRDLQELLRRWLAMAELSATRSTPPRSGPEWTAKPDVVSRGEDMDDYLL